jgi:hypothetical protein
MYLIGHMNRIETPALVLFLLHLPLTRIIFLRNGNLVFAIVDHAMARHTRCRHFSHCCIQVWGKGTAVDGFFLAWVDVQSLCRLWTIYRE